MPPGGRARDRTLPLFDRLLSRPPHGIDASLRASVSRELRDLLNTRLGVPPEAIEGTLRSTLNYGLPDMSAFPMGSMEGRERLIHHLESAIIAFEPRLAMPRVSLITETGPGSLLVEIAGSIGGEAVTFHASIAHGKFRLTDAT